MTDRPANELLATKFNITICIEKSCYLLLNYLNALDYGGGYSMRILVLSIMLVLSVSCASVGGSDCMLVPGTLICIEK